MSSTSSHGSRGGSSSSTCSTSSASSASRSSSSSSSSGRTPGVRSQGKDRQRDKQPSRTVHEATLPAMSDVGIEKVTKESIEREARLRSLLSMRTLGNTMSLPTSGVYPTPASHFWCRTSILGGDEASVFATFSNSLFFHAFLDTVQPVTAQKVDHSGIGTDDNPNLHEQQVGSAASSPYHDPSDVVAVLRCCNPLFCKRFLIPKPSGSISSGSCAQESSSGERTTAQGGAVRLGEASPVSVAAAATALDQEYRREWQAAMQLRSRVASAQVRLRQRRAEEEREKRRLAAERKRRRDSLAVDDSSAVKRGGKPTSAGGLVASSRDQWERHMEAEAVKEGNTIASLRQSQNKSSFLEKQRFQQWAKASEYQQELALQRRAQDLEDTRESRRRGKADAMTEIG